MKTSLSILLLIFTNLVFAQKAEEVHSFAKVNKPHSFYVEQAELWWKVLEKDKKQENAWYNYFKANRFAKGSFNEAYRFDEELNKGWLSESKFLMETDEIIKLTDKFIPGTFTNHYIKWWNGGADPANFEHLQKAFEIDPSHPEMYDGFVVYYETQGNLEKRKEFNKEWYTLNDMSPSLLNMAYNILASVEHGGIILTFGDNDTFPLWMLQDQFGIRTDVTVLCVPLLSIDDYRAMQFSKLGIPNISVKDESATKGNEDAIVAHIFSRKPKNLHVYVSLPAWKSFKNYDDNLYLTGIVLQYSEENLDNVAIMKNNFENKYMLDYLYYQFSYDVSNTVVDYLNVNYLPALIKLYEHSKLSGDLSSAEKYRKLGLLIAGKGNEQWKKNAVEVFNKHNAGISN